MKQTVPLAILFACALSAAAAEPPNIILVMADDQGWGQTGYYNHPLLKTPSLDAMAAAGLRFDRFYAGAPVCSPTRATVMTGRTNDRTGVQNHGFGLRTQERTIAQALRKAGYETGHFGKWHLNGIRGPGVPIFAADDQSPSVFGFGEWLSVTNFFDRNPVMSRMGKFEEFKGDSSEIIVAEAMKFISKQAAAKQRFFTVIWYGTPHDPMVASEADMKGFEGLDDRSRNQLGELVAMDRSIGALRSGLRDLGVEQETLVWYTSDNGGLPRIEPSTVGGLRGFKGSVYEGGLRVPAIIEWPQKISRPRITKYPAATVDIFPTLAEIVGLPDSALEQPQDGLSLAPLFEKELKRREKPLGFRYLRGEDLHAALIDNDLKLVTVDVASAQYALYDLGKDEKETTDIYSSTPAEAKRMRMAFEAWNASVEASVAGNDYPEGKTDPAESEPIFWMELEQYEPYFDEWRKRPEYARRLEGVN